MLYIIAAFLVIRINSFKETHIPKVGVAILVYWIILYCYCFLSGFKCTFSCIVQHFLYHNMDIGTNHVILYIGQQYLITVYRTGFGVCAVLVLSVIRCSCYYFLDRIIFHHDFHHASCDYHLDFYGHSLLLNYILGFLYLSSYGSANAQLPGWFCPWTFPLNIGLNMLPLDSFMSCLHSLLGYSTGEFQALQLIVLAVFGAVD